MGQILKVINFPIFSRFSRFFNFSIFQIFRFPIFSIFDFSDFPIFYDCNRFFSYPRWRVQNLVKIGQTGQKLKSVTDGQKNVYFNRISFPKSQKSTISCRHLFKINLNENSTLIFSPDKSSHAQNPQWNMAKTLEQKQSHKHHSSNYGGNIQVSKDSKYFQVPRILLNLAWLIFFNIVWLLLNYACMYFDFVLLFWSHNRNPMMPLILSTTKMITIDYETWEWEI